MVQFTLSKAQGERVPSHGANLPQTTYSTAAYVLMGVGRGILYEQSPEPLRLRHVRDTVRGFAVFSQQEDAMPRSHQPLRFCKVCGYPITDMHHIVPKRYGGSDDADNLIALCPNHHRAFHALISELLWWGNQIDHLQMYEESLPRKSRRHRLALLAALSDGPLLTLFNDVFTPRWRAARPRFWVPGPLRTDELRRETEKSLGLVSKEKSEG